MKSKDESQVRWMKGVNDVFNKDNPEDEYISSRLGNLDEIFSFLQTSVDKGIEASTLNFRKFIYGANTLSFWLTIKPLFFHITSNPVLYSSILLLATCVSYTYLFNALIELSNYFIIFLPTFLISLMNLATDLYITLKLTKLISGFEYKVTRNTNKCKILYKDIVVGDIIHLDSGEIAPSDILILNSSNLYINDSFYTGKARDTKYDGSTIKSNSEIISGKITGVVLAVGKNRVSYRNFGNNAFFETGTEYQQWIISHYEKPLKIFFILFFFFKVLHCFLSKGLHISDFLSFTGMLPTLFSSFLIINLYLLISSAELGRKIPFLVYSKAYLYLRPLSYQLSLQKFTTLSEISTICVDLSNISQTSPKIISLSIGTNLSISLSELYQVSNNSLELLITALSTILQIEHSNSKISIQTLSAFKDFLLKFDTTKIRVFFTVKQIFFFEPKNLFIFVVESNKTVTFYAYGPCKYLAKFCKYFISSEGKKTDFSEREKSRLLNEFVKTKEGRGRKVIGIAYKQLSLQEWLKDAGENGEYSLNQSLESLVMIGSLEISYPVHMKILEDIKKSIESGIDIKIITEDNIKSAVSIGKSCGILPNQYKLTLEDKFIISGEDLIINNNILMNSPNGYNNEHDINKRISGIKVLAEANDAQKSIFLKKNEELYGKIVRIEQKSDLDEFSFGIKDYEFVIEAIRWSKFGVLVGKWYLYMYNEILGTGFFIGLWVIKSDTGIGVEIWYFFIGFATFLGFFTLILILVEPDFEGIEKSKIEKLEFSYGIVFFRVFFNIFCAFFTIGNIESSNLFAESVECDKIRNSDFTQNYKGLFVLKYLMYSNLISLLVGYKFWKKNQLLRAFIASLIALFCEKGFLLDKLNDGLVELNYYILILCIPSMVVRRILEKLFRWT